MFNIHILLLACSILSSSWASPAGQYSRQQDVCPAIVTVTAAIEALQAATSTSFVTLNPTTVTVISSVCNWTSASLFVIASYPTSSSGSSASSLTTFSGAASSASSTYSQSSLATVPTTSIILSTAASSTSYTLLPAPSSSITASKTSSVLSSYSTSIFLGPTSSVSSASNNVSAAAVSSSFLSNTSNGSILPAATLYTTIIDNVTITSTVVVDDYATSIIDVNVYSTIYNVASACSAVPTIANPEFNTPLPYGSCAGGSSLVAGYDISTDTNYYYNGPDSVQFSFAAGSSKADILSISQVVTVCPDRVYDFNVYATQDSSNTGNCKAWISTVPQIGTTKVGNAVFLGYGNDAVDGWSGIDVSFNNAASNSYQITLAISAYCVSGNTSVVYLDTVSVNVE